MILGLEYYQWVTSPIKWHTVMYHILLSVILMTLFHIYLDRHLIYTLQKMFDPSSVFKDKHKTMKIYH